MADGDQVDISELAAYDSDDEAQISVPAGQAPVPQARKDYIDVHVSGFRDFYLKPEILRAITDCGFEHPSTVQSECIPQATRGTDVICQATSGMGKTAVFVLSVLQQLTPVDGEVSCLVLCHIRELAYQAKNEFDRFKKYLPDIRADVFFGGTSVAADREKLKNPPHIVIGTPGRILQLAEEGSLKLNNIKYFVIDECDEVLSKEDMRNDVTQIFVKTPRQKQVMMFSATMSEEVKLVCKRFMHQPVEIYVNDGSKLTLHGLQQYYVNLEENEKTRKLCDVLDTLEFNQVVIFVRSVQRAKALARILTQETFPAIVMHSKMRQEKRIERYKQFKEFKARLIVSTNLFGRGVDFERVNFVINYDMAETSDTYLHRVGRAGRFGTKGLAISFISSEDDKQVLEDVRAKFSVPIPELPAEIDPSSYMLN